MTKLIVAFHIFLTRLKTLRDLKVRNVKKSELEIIINYYVSCRNNYDIIKKASSFNM